MTLVMKDHTELLKQVKDNEGSMQWMSDTAFGLTYQESGPGPRAG